jgi:hypothetical protein
MKKKRQILLLGLVLAAGFGLTACNPIEDQSQSASLLTVLTVQGVDSTGNQSDFLNSDVVKVDTTTGLTTVFADSAIALLKVSTLDPNPVGGVSQYNDVTVDRYVVSYSQPNGANREGVDVPYSFEAMLTRTIPVNSQDSLAFIVVRLAAKLESPLVQLVDSGDILQCTARIDFYGHDQANKTVKATGYLPIFFSNYADAAAGAAAMTSFALR